MGQLDPAGSVGEIPLMEALGLLQVLGEGNLQGGGQEGDAVLGALALANGDGAGAEVDVLDPEAAALHESHAGSVEQAGHEPGRAVEEIEDRAYLVACQDDGQAAGLLGAHDSLEPVHSLGKDVAIEEEQRIERLVLSGGADLADDRKAGEEPDDFGVAHLRGMPLAVEVDEAPDPVGVRAIGGAAVVLHADGSVNEVHEPQGGLGVTRGTLAKGHGDAKTHGTIGLQGRLGGSRGGFADRRENAGGRFAGGRGHGRPCGWLLWRLAAPLALCPLFLIRPHDRDLVRGGGDADGDYTPLPEGRQRAWSRLVRGVS